MERKLTDQQLLTLAIEGRASVDWTDKDDYKVGLCSWEGTAHPVSCWLQQRLADLFHARLPLTSEQPTWVLAGACWTQPTPYGPILPAVDQAGNFADVMANDGVHYPWLVRGPDEMWAHLPGGRHPAVPKLRRKYRDLYVPRALYPNMQGEDVSELQRALGIDVTGFYDAAAVKAVEAFQREHGLETSGVFGKATRAQLYHKTKPTVTLGAGTRVLARNFTPGRTEPVRVVCVHEVPEDFSAREIADLFAHPKRPPQASVHYVLGVEGDLYTCVPEQHTAWGAPGCNAYALHVVVVGAADSSSLVESLCERHNVPRTWLTAQELIDGRAGMTTHATVRLALGIATEKNLVVEPWFNTKYGVFRQDKACLMCCEVSVGSVGSRYR